MNEGTRGGSKRIEKTDGIRVESDAEFFAIMSPGQTVRIFGPTHATFDGVEHVDDAAHFDVPNLNRAATLVVVSNPASGSEVLAVRTDGEGDDFREVGLTMDESRALFAEDRYGALVQVTDARSAFCGEQLAAYAGEAIVGAQEFIQVDDRGIHRGRG